jgi:pimeloyl-ACP methyl ester carboxylesterase
MPAVLVHGVPETPPLWRSLRSHLARTDVVTLSLPGFGNPRPDGFGATKDDYAAWLIGELEAVGEPVDLVGHDWGGGFTVRAVSLRPDLVRTWVTDAAGLADPGFVWHDFAKIWQTAGEGEAFWEQQLALPLADRAGVFLAFGVPEEDALALAGAIDATMAGCILDLYRSATAVQEEWGPEFVDIPKPGLVVVPSDDPFLDGGGATRAAERAGARIERIEGAGHWWMTQDPAGAAAILEAFWAPFPAVGD